MRKVFRLYRLSRQVLRWVDYMLSVDPPEPGGCHAAITYYTSKVERRRSACIGERARA